VTNGSYARAPGNCCALEMTGCPHRLAPESSFTLRMIGFHSCSYIDGPIRIVELPAKVKRTWRWARKSDLVRAAGYVSTKKDGSERLTFTAFYGPLEAIRPSSFG